MKRFSVFKLIQLNVVVPSIRSHQITVYTILSLCFTSARKIKLNNVLKFCHTTKLRVPTASYTRSDMAVALTRIFARDVITSKTTSALPRLDEFRLPVRWRLRRSLPQLEIMDYD